MMLLMQKVKVLHSKVTVASYKSCWQITNYRYGIPIKGRVVSGHHVYKEVWRPVIGQFPVLAEPTNCHDKQAVAIYRDGEIVGHVHRELASC